MISQVWVRSCNEFDLQFHTVSEMSNCEDYAHVSRSER